MAHTVVPMSNDSKAVRRQNTRGHLTPDAVPRQRWAFLDTLRGFALAGILLVNSLDISRLGYENTTLEPDPTREILYLTVQTRFVPIFVVLFGMSLFLILRGARERAPRPWLPLVRRLVTLAAIGGLLMLVYPGNILVEYGTVGLAILPAVLFAPRWLVLALGMVGTSLAYALLGGGFAATPGLMLLGAAAAAYGVPAILEAGGRGVAIVALATAALAIPAIIWQLTEPGDPRFTLAGGVAGLVLAVAYTMLLSALWRTPARRTLSAVFDSLGRMALTNYVTGALLVAATAAVVDFTRMPSAWPAVAMSLVIIAVQSLASRAWLSRFSYGPVEWLLRIATWGRPVSLRRDRSSIRGTA